VSYDIELTAKGNDALTKLLTILKLNVGNMATILASLRPSVWPETIFMISFYSARTSPAAPSLARRQMRIATSLPSEYCMYVSCSSPSSLNSARKLDHQF